MAAPPARPPLRRPRVTIVIPARNEAARIGAVLDSLADGLPSAACQVVVVDDGSTDGTPEIARGRGAVVVQHAVNLGKGGALRTGCEAALELGCEVLVAMDADGQHRAADLPRLIRPIVEGRADVTLGRRRFSRRMPVAMRLGNWGLSWAFAVLFRQQVADTQCGLRALRADVYRSIAWQASDYSVETEMLVRAARASLILEEVEIDTVYLDAYKGTTIGDGIRIFSDMLRWRLRRS